MKPAAFKTVQHLLHSCHNRKSKVKHKKYKQNTIQ